MHAPGTPVKTGCENRRSRLSGKPGLWDDVLASSQAVKVLAKLFLALGIHLEIPSVIKDSIKRILCNKERYLMPARFLSSPLLILLSLTLWAGVVLGQSPRLSVTQVGLHFICTADGQPDMYSWRIPVKETNFYSYPSDYKIPEIAPGDLEALAQGTLPVVSGGRTALRVREEDLDGLYIEHRPPIGFEGSQARLINLDAVHWRDSSIPPDGWLPAYAMKRRFYSNFPPLSQPHTAGSYGTTSIHGTPGSVNYGRYYQRHPGYDWGNWNWTLEPDSPLQVNQKRLQALLHLELHHPPTTDPDKPFEFTFVISGEDMNGIRVNDRSIFSSTRDRVIKTRKNLFQTTGVTEVGGFADSRKFSLGRRGGPRPPMPEDDGYDPSSGLVNLELDSDYFTITRDEKLQFQSGLITLRIYDTHNWTETQPLQTVQVRLPSGQAPQPDLVTVGTHWVQYVQPSGEFYNHPAVQAPRWWGFNRDGVIGRYDNTGVSVDPDFGTLGSQRGRLFNWDGRSMTGGFSAVSAVIPSSNTQRLPGARALIYAADPVLYPDLQLRAVGELEADPLLRIEYQAPDYNRPLHFGSDVLRTVAATNALEPRPSLLEQDFITPPDYDNPNVRVARGRGFDTPKVRVPPQSQSIPVGDAVTFTAKVASTLPLTYQWRYEGANIPDATGSSYSVPKVSKDFQGKYDVVASNGQTTVTSLKADLIVLDPFIVTQPQSQMRKVGENVTFTVVANGTGLKYQWRRNGRAIAKATTAKLELSRLKDTDQAMYDVVITGELGTVVSDSARLTVESPLQILQHPIGGYLPAGGEFKLKVLAVGPGPISYTWRNGGSPIEGASGPELILTDAGGRFDVIVRNPQGETIVSKVAVVTLLQPAPVFTQHPTSLSVAIGAEARFTVEVIEQSDLKFQWRRNGVDVRQGTASTLIITNAQKTHEGQYDCLVTTPSGRALSSQASLSVGESLGFETLPQNQIVTLGETATFTVAVAGGDLGVTFQWALNGKPLSGAIYPTLSVTGVNAAQVGTYTVTASKPPLKASASALLILKQPGVLIYKLTGTGQTYSGTENVRMGVAGYLLVERTAAESDLATMILVTQAGKLKHFSVQHLSGFRADSTGAAPGAMTVFSSVVEGHPVADRSLRWFQGTNSLIPLRKGLESILAPRTLTGQCDHLEPSLAGSGHGVQLDRIAFKGVLDIPFTADAHQSSQSLEQVIERIKILLQLQGAISSETDPEE